MAHLPPSHFAHVFEPLQGKRIGFVRPTGNVGDMLIEMATLQLFDHFGIQWTYWRPDESLEPLQELVFGGGGNMGQTYRCNWDLRQTCLQTGLPVTILPQSFLGPEKRPFRRVYVREQASFQYAPEGILAPDLALGLRTGLFAAATNPLGIFLRRDLEACKTAPWYSLDPVELARTPREYLQLASRYEAIITNRLHFAVAGILLDRKVILLPNSYHKNTSMHETWLGDLGCNYAHSLEEALQRINGTRLSWFFQARHFISSAAQRVRADRRKTA